ncbi:acyltransferase family protein [Sphingorhabdus lutea]|nr:acyltransferase [Sphingorhabdus lutea]
MIKNKDYRTAINALRGFAAIYVVFYHLRYFTIYPWFREFPPLKYGYIGVDFFFMLSGLIIAHVYLKKAQHFSAKFWANFLWLRIARLLPVHLLIMVFLLCSAYIAAILGNESKWPNGENLLDWLLLATLVRQWTLPDTYVWNEPAWSVSAEMFAYIFIFPIAALFHKFFNEKLYGMAAILIGAAILYYIIDDKGSINAIKNGGPLLRVAGGFMIGFGLFLLLNQIKTNKIYDPLLAISIISIFIILLNAPTIKKAGILIDLLLLANLAAIIMAVYVSNGPIARFLSAKPLFWLGEISFSLYLCHSVILGILSHWAKIWDIDRGIIMGDIMLLFSLAAAHLLYKFVEIPAREAMRNAMQKYLS